jgi:hypothetical protein
VAAQKFQRSPLALPPGRRPALAVPLARKHEQLNVAIAVRERCEQPCRVTEQDVLVNTPVLHEGMSTEIARSW